MNLLKPREVARILGFSTQALYRMRASGWGPPFIKLESGSIRYPQDKLVDWIENRSKK